VRFTLLTFRLGFDQIASSLAIMSLLGIVVVRPRQSKSVGKTLLGRKPTFACFLSLPSLVLDSLQRVLSRHEYSRTFSLLFLLIESSLRSSLAVRMGPQTYGPRAIQ